MLEIDLTQIETYDETFDQCDTKLADAIYYMRNTIIPILGNFTQVDKQAQLIQIDELVSYTADLVHLVKTVHNLDINKASSQSNNSDDDEEEEDDCSCLAV